jgi:hypothetical protein
MRVVRHLLDKPVKSVAYETLLHITCTSADGAMDSDSALEKIWQEFEDRDVRRKDGKRLTYYGSWLVENTETDQLLMDLDGQCGAWAKTFINCLWHQGVNTGEWCVIRADNPEYFLVKNWRFDGNGTSGDPQYPYLNVAAIDGPYPPLVRPDHYEWISAEVIDARGIPGQGLKIRTRCLVITRLY